MAADVNSARPTHWRVFVGVLLALLVGELWSQRVSSVRHAWDPVLGEGFAPGQRFVLWGEGSGSGVISAYGTRVSGARDERLPPPDAQPIPVLVLGDSFAEALQVDDEELFSNRVAHLLAADGLHLRVTNAARSAYSMADYVCRADVFDRIFAPRWVVVQINAADFLVDPSQPFKDRAAFRWNAAQLECAAPVLSPPPPQRGALRSFAHAVREAIGLPAMLIERVRARMAADDERLPLFFAAHAGQAVAPASATQTAPVDEELALLRAGWGPRLTLLYLPPFDPGAPAKPQLARRGSGFAVCVRNSTRS